jgi:hypothetical protein
VILPNAAATAALRLSLAGVYALAVFQLQADVALISDSVIWGVRLKY